MCELLFVRVPNCITQLLEFFTHFDQLKRIMNCYKTHCCLKEGNLNITTSKKRSIYPSNLQHIVNIKKPKGTHASISFK